MLLLFKIEKAQLVLAVPFGENGNELGVNTQTGNLASPV